MTTRVERWENGELVEVVDVPDTPETTRATNAATLHDRARQALTANATFLAVASPTNAQTLAQVRALTRQMNALIRLTVNELDDTAGT